MNKITISTGHPYAGRVYAEAYEEALARETALREELERVNSSFDELASCVGFSEARLDQTGDSPMDCANQLQQRLTVAEQRVGELVKLLSEGKEIMSEIWDRSYDHEAEDALALKPDAVSRCD